VLASAELDSEVEPKVEAQNVVLLFDGQWEILTRLQFLFKSAFRQASRALKGEVGSVSENMPGGNARIAAAARNHRNKNCPPN
jgi:hypothetical protein